MEKARRGAAVAGLAAAAMLVSAVWGGCTTTSKRQATPTETFEDTFTATISPTATATGTATFTPTNTPTITRTFTASFAAIGHLVVAGGLVAQNTFVSNTVWCAPVSSTGQVGNWVPQPNLPQPRSFFDGAYAGGYVYTASGVQFSGSAVSFAATAGGGSVGPWSTTSAWPAAAFAFGFGMAGGYLFGWAGESVSTFTEVSDCYSAQIVGGGVLGAWNSTAPLPTPLAYVAGTSDGTYLYSAGGDDGNMAVSSVFVGTVSGGTVTGWSAAAPLPAALSGGAAITGGGNLFVIGGDNGSAIFSTVYVGQAVGGTVGGWTTGTPLPTGLTNPKVTSVGGFAFLVGGFNSSSATVSSVYVAPFSAGVLGSWTSTTPLPGPRAGMVLTSY